MYYTIYQITNLLNNKIYIGKHQTINLDDNYMGSGKLIVAAIKKYGVENFSKEILHIFDSEEEMNIREKELIDEQFILREDTYNICIGGQGGWSFVNRNNLSINSFENKNIQQKAQRKAQKRKRSLMENDIEWRKKYSEKLSISCKKFGKENNFYGKNHSDETKLKMSKSHKGKHSKDKNSQFGTMWITNGVDNKKIKKNEPIPYKWRKGRIIKKSG